VKHARGCDEQARSAKLDYPSQASLATAWQAKARAKGCEARRPIIKLRNLRYKILQKCYQSKINGNYIHANCSLFHSFLHMQILQHKSKLCGLDFFIPSQASLATAWQAKARAKGCEARTWLR